MARPKAQLRLGAFFNPTGHHVASWRHPTRAGRRRHQLQALRRDRADRRARQVRHDLPRRQRLRARGQDGGAVALGAVHRQLRADHADLGAGRRHRADRARPAPRSTSYNEPFHVARKFASLDHISGGRAGWNLVTSGMAAEAPNFSRDAHYGHAERYERANEFAEIVTALWDSWDDDAFMRDKESGLFFDPAKLHTLNHKGKHFQVRGPLNIPRSPQGHPVIVQAGTSDDGMDVAARFAEVIFGAPLTIEASQQYFKEVKTRAQDKFGRNPDHLKVMPGLSRLRRPHRGGGRREIRLPELADAPGGGARNPVDGARQRRPDALRLRRAAARQPADVEREPEHVQIRHRVGARRTSSPCARSRRWSPARAPRW